MSFILSRDDTFIHAESVQVTVADSGDNIVFSATYGKGDDFVRINDDEELYIANWHTGKKMRGENSITVEFDNGFSKEKSITFWPAGLMDPSITAFSPSKFNRRLFGLKPYSDSHLGN